MKNFKELKTWQYGIEIVKATYKLSQQLPKEEKFGMISQMNRAAVSIPANIAEGSSRDSDKDYARFLQIALGSAFELQTHLIIVQEMNWINDIELQQINALLESEIRMLYNFSKKLVGSQQLKKSNREIV